MFLYSGQSNGLMVMVLKCFSRNDAGQFYFGRTEAWLENIITFSEKSTIVTIPPYRAVDIDYEEDWIRAELIMELLKSCK